jgi:hypothetical protein
VATARRSAAGAEALLAPLAALESRSQARDERIELLEEENRWLKAQLFGHSSEKTPAEERGAASGTSGSRFTPYVVLNLCSTAFTPNRDWDVAMQVLLVGLS